jgi:hypothetical protein
VRSCLNNLGKAVVYAARSGTNLARGDQLLQSATPPGPA